MSITITYNAFPFRIRVEKTIWLWKPWLSTKSGRARKALKQTSLYLLIGHCASFSGIKKSGKENVTRFTFRDSLCQCTAIQQIYCKWRMWIEHAITVPRNSSRSIYSATVQELPLSIMVRFLALFFLIACTLLFVSAHKKSFFNVLFILSMPKASWKCI